MNVLILITKPEADRIREVYPNVSIVRTCIQKSQRHRYYLVESEKYLRLIQDTNMDAAKICDRLDRDRERKNKYRR